MAIATPTGRPKTVRNRCVIEAFGGVFELSRAFLDLVYGRRGYCHRTEPDLFIFPYANTTLNCKNRGFTFFCV